MEFWGAEVKAGQPLKVRPTFGNIIHLSQASLGESKKEKGRESVPLFVKFGDQKLVLGTLITENIPQLSFDLVFEKEFELSHNWINGSVYFCGYQTPLPQDSRDELDMDDLEEDEEMELRSFPAENGEAASKVEKAKIIATKADDAKPAKPSKDVKFEDDDDSELDDEDDSDDEMLDGDDSDKISGEEGDSDEEDEEDSDDDEDSDEDEETPKKAVLGKKRPTESATETPIPSKKSKTPMTDGKKGGHVATPHPSKQGAKTLIDKTQMPKSGGQHTCRSCSKSFGSDNALQSHTKAKHSGK